MMFLRLCFTCMNERLRGAPRKAVRAFARRWKVRFEVALATRLGLNLEGVKRVLV